MATFKQNVPVQANSVPVTVQSASASAVAASGNWILASKARAFAVICQTSGVATNATVNFMVAYSNANTGANMTTVTGLTLANITTASQFVIAEFIPTLANIPASMYWSPQICVLTAGATVGAAVVALDPSYPA